MEFEWDEKKARANLEKHGIDFQGAIRVFEAEAVWMCSRNEEAKSGGKQLVS